jgi:error-prone DNA polymerase
MATFRHVGTIHTFREKFIAGMVGNGYQRDFAERCFSQIEGFGEYGFPESHAASFALLVYVSSWIKCYYPEVFCAALLNSQPMGFYQPAQLVRDAREHGVEVRHPDINASDWDCTLEPAPPSPRATSTSPCSPPARGEGRGEGQRQTPTHGRSSPLPLGRGREAMTCGRELQAIQEPEGNGAAVSHSAELVRGELRDMSESESRCAVRLGLRLVGGAWEEATKAIAAARGPGYPDLFSVWTRSRAPVGVLERLANADAFRSLGLDRRAALWAVKGLGGGALQAGPRRAASALAPILTQGETGDLFAEPHVDLPATTLGEHVVEDYAAIGLSLKAHPVAFFREDLNRRGVLTSQAHWQERLAGRRVAVAGLVLVRQRPGTAKGVIFLTLEDETGIVNVVVWPKVFERNRRIVMTAQFLEVRGRIEREGLVIHVVADQLIDLTHDLKRLGEGTAGMPRTDKEIREGSWKPRSRDFH